MNTRFAFNILANFIGMLAAFPGFIGRTSNGADDTHLAKAVLSGKAVDQAQPQPVSAPFTITVADADGKPVAGAGVDGMYQSPTNEFDYVVADAQGTIKIERALVPLVLRAATPDYSRAGVLRVDAEAMLAKGLAKANAENKRVFLILSGLSCVPCRMLARFLAANKTELERHYVFVKLDLGRDAHADAVRQRYESKDDINGVPWYVILDGAGNPLITSNAKELANYGPTNIGFPGSKEGIDHLMKMFRQTAPGLSEGALARLRRELEKKP